MLQVLLENGRHDQNRPSANGGLKACSATATTALAAGGRDNGEPGLRPRYHPSYYGACVLDPDGHNIEAVCHDAPDAAGSS